MTNSSVYADVFHSLQQWVEEARTHSTTRPSDISLLLREIPSGSRSITRAEQSSYQSQTLISFDVKGQGGIGVKTRHVLPVHFAVLRVLDLVPHMRLVLRDDPHKRRPKKDGNLPSPTDIMYHLYVQVAPKKAHALRIPQRFKADRILFNAPPNATVYERRAGDHHYIVPSGSILIRHRGSPLITQESLLRAVQELACSAHALDGIGADGTIEILSKLFSLGDDWHWYELLDRDDDSDPFTGWHNRTPGLVKS